MDKLGTELQAVEEETAIALRKAFAPFFEEAKEWKEKAMSIVVTSEDQKEDMKLARESRLVLQKLRVNLEKMRKSLKAESLKKGKAIDGIANSFKDEIIPIEAHLQEQEDFVKNKIAAEKEKIRAERTIELEQYDVLISTVADLSEMDSETYSALLESSKRSFNLKIEEDRKAEEKRAEQEKAESEERERVAKENEKLRKEAIDREKKADAERKKQEKIIAEQKAKADAEKKERERLESEIRAKEESERKEKADAEAKARTEEENRLKEKRDAELAPDKEKLELLADVLTMVKMPEVSDDKAKRIISETINKLNAICVFIKQESMNL